MKLNKPLPPHTSQLHTHLCSDKDLHLGWFEQTTKPRQQQIQTVQLDVSCLRSGNILTAAKVRKQPLLPPPSTPAGFGNCDHDLSHFESHRGVSADSGRAVITGCSRLVRQQHVDWSREDPQQQPAQKLQAIHVKLLFTHLRSKFKHPALKDSQTQRQRFLHTS